MLIGTHNHGQGHETTFAQIVSELGVASTMSDVFGDTDRVQFGMGTYGSRSPWSEAPRSKPATRWS